MHRYCKFTLLGMLGAGMIAAGGNFQQASAQGRPYDGLQAGQDAYERGEAQRQQNIADQASLNDSLQAWRSQPGRVVYYRPPYFNQVGNGAIRANVTFGSTWGGGIGGYRSFGYDSGYDIYQQSVYGGLQNYYVVPADPGLGYYRRGAYGGMYRPGYTIYSPSYPTPLIRQPVGQWNGQTGPNRWESHPVYGDEDERAYSQPESAPSRSPIVQPKIIVPPREY